MPIWSPAFFGSGAGSSGYVVEDSIWLDGSADYLSKAVSTTQSSTTAWSLSMWLKVDTKNASRPIWSTPSNLTMGALQSSGEGYQDKIRFYGDNLDTRTDAVFRDPSGWFNVVWVWDSANGTQASRARIYINGSEASTTGTKSVTSSQATDFMNTGQTTDLFKQTGASLYYSGYAAEIIFLDGTASTDCSQFGEYNDNGVWVPINPSGLTYGDNGFLLQFKQNGSGQDANGIGADTSGEDNHFAVGGGAIQTNQVTDTCTDDADNDIGNYATLNSVAAVSQTGSVTLSEGNLKVVGPSSAFWGVPSTMTLPSSGKFYAEAKINGAGTSSKGGGLYVMTPGTELDVAHYTGGQEAVWGWHFQNNRHLVSNGADTSVAIANSDGDIAQIAIDLDNDKVYMGINNTWYSAVNTTTTAPDNSGTQTFSLDAAGKQIAANGYNNSGSVEMNFGATAFAYTPPTGYKAINTNLPAPTVADPSAGYQAVIDTESNIVSTLASARSGWTNYMEWLNNRDAREGVLIRFSHDSSNEYDVSGNGASYQSTSTLSGSNNWSGLAFKIDSAYGTAAGSASHTNGSATTVTHNLGSTDCFIILLPRNSGEHKVYHSSFSAGTLAALTAEAVPSASTIITNITTNAFDIGSGATTDTYDYFIMVDTEGYSSIGSYTGNAAADGPVIYTGHTPGFFLTKRTGTIGNWWYQNDAMSPYNPAQDAFYIDGTTGGADTTSAQDTDFLAGGAKLRNGGGRRNAADTYLYVSVGSAAFGGDGVAQARAR